MRSEWHARSPWSRRQLATVGRPREATRVFRRIVEITPTDVNAHRNLAKALLNEDQIDAAESETNVLLRLKAADAVGHDLKGRVLASRGHLPEARAEFERAATLTKNARQRELLLERARACELG